VAEREDEQKRVLLEEDVFEKLKLYGNAGDDDVSVVSYVLSRRSSYTESLPPGLGNRVRTNSLTLFGASFGVEKTNPDTKLGKILTLSKLRISIL